MRIIVRCETPRYHITASIIKNLSIDYFCQTPVLGLGLGVYFTFAWDNHKNHNHCHNHNNPHLHFVKGTVLGDKELGIGIRDMEYVIRDKG